MNDLPPLVNTRRAARWLGMDVKTFQGLVQANNLTAISTGRTWLWRRVELEQLAGQPVKEDA